MNAPPVDFTFDIKDQFAKQYLFGSGKLEQFGVAAVHVLGDGEARIPLGDPILFGAAEKSDD